jgi:hypothetical protein
MCGTAWLRRRTASSERAVTKVRRLPASSSWRNSTYCLRGKYRGDGGMVEEVVVVLMWLR